MAARRERMAVPVGEAGTSRQHVREAKMATFNRSRRRGSVLQFQMGSLKAISNLNRATAAGADGTRQVFEIVQPEVDVAIRATLGDISRRCAARLPLYSASLRGELSTSLRSSRPPHTDEQEPLLLRTDSDAMYNFPQFAFPRSVTATATSTTRLPDPLKAHLTDLIASGHGRTTKH
ncbi:hypothetical protein HPB50_003264 [Hyalomma asiaticum]|uniref:Uncharacterized protein n=1 Tax=Hyalomma asiaticum TaxID=266040 RepID=A0ACB7S016_HYAAI|nr:hypothetical protein HPB50_003264 [Hyalomma asiaticum]